VAYFGEDTKGQVVTRKALIEVRRNVVFSLPQVLLIPTNDLPMLPVYIYYSMFWLSSVWAIMALGRGPIANVVVLKLVVRRVEQRSMAEGLASIRTGHSHVRRV